METNETHIMLPLQHHFTALLRTDNFFYKLRHLISYEYNILGTSYHGYHTLHK